MCRHQRPTDSRKKARTEVLESTASQAWTKAIKKIIVVLIANQIKSNSVAIILLLTQGAVVELLELHCY